ncbi:hypothetical protein K2173_000542 [Erythroxylum novogranatense]|uniref:Putative gamma-glutamylcyclotransferase n=1 Tax=Erythroxylum novogranatense TaxID=1862640 RepID=A0AAV8SXF9_9ROSI|nr:hypothetical protein K2173_000542 [Erythroxylum novogranatense]
MGSSAAAGSGLHKVFVYGSLLADDVVSVLLNRIPQSSTAVLDGYHRFSIKGRVYPAILPVENKKVTGKVFFGITNSELDILDVFEDEEYKRRPVDVSLRDSSDEVQVFAYVWSDKDDPNLYGEWDFEQWKITHMNDFIKMTQGFKEELDLPESKTRVATYESFYQEDQNSSPMP